MKRYERFVLEAGEGISLEVSEGVNGEGIIRASEIDTTIVENAYSTNYVTPPILQGYKHICGEWNNGFVIERYSDGSQFVWVPVGSLKSNGTLDGKNFLEKLGKRKLWYEKYLCDELKRPFNEKLFEQLESVKKYGGFYISRHNISKSLEGKPQSIKGVMPWSGESFYLVENLAAMMEDNESVKSHLTFGVEYDSIVEWIIETKAKTLAEIIKESTEWGNYINTTNSPNRIVKTGSREKWCVNNIYDFAGNLCEMTDEKNEHDNVVIRGGCYYDDGRAYPVFYRRFLNKRHKYSNVGFRVALCIR